MGAEGFEFRQSFHLKSTMEWLSAYQDWIDEETSGEALKNILKDPDQKEFAFRPVSKAVNKVENNSAELIKEA
jgi:putative SOS response-associated peptidase YedK